MTNLDWMDRWPRSHPHPERAWTVSCDGRFGALEPEIGRVWPVVPGRDRHLPGLARALNDGAMLVGYRVGRRAALHHGDRDRWVKVVRPRRTAGLVAVHEHAASAVPVDTPRVVASYDDGRIELTTVPGRALHHVIRSRPWVVSSWLPVVAEAVAALHRSTRFGPDRPPDRPHRSLRIVGRAEPEVLDWFEAGAERLPPLVGGTPAAVHGDLHDKNVLVSPGSGSSTAGLIDLDGLGWGVAEDDVANLAVHLDLRALQLGIETIWSDELVAAYPGPLDPHRLDAARRHTYFRLAALYRFRDPGRELSDELHRRATLGTLCLPRPSTGSSQSQSSVEPGRRGHKVQAAAIGGR